MAIPSTVLRKSVGLGGANQRDDVLLMQKLLNAVPSARGGPMPALDVDGMCGMQTCGAIRRFQTSSGAVADGRVDPGKKTEQVLLALLSSLGVLAGLLAGTPGAAPGAAAPQAPQAPVASGPHSRVRQRFLSVCKGLLPPQGQLASDPQGGSGTGCGGFPGRVFSNLPVIPPGQPGAFKVNAKGIGTLYLTTPMTAWEQFAQAVDAQYAPARKTWVPFSGNRPMPGDIYTLCALNSSATFKHVGIILSAEGSDWLTGDSGQGNGWQRGIVKRRFHANGQIDGEFGSQARLKGWVDLDALYAVAMSAFPQNL